VRRRYTAVDEAGAAVGYGSLEQDETDRSRYRLRLLMEGEAKSIVERLERDLAELHATVVWERVDRDEPALFDFLQRTGMRVVREVTVGAYRYVTLERPLG
jgi:hypothetical protein